MIGTEAAPIHMSWRGEFRVDSNLDTVAMKLPLNAFDLILLAVIVGGLLRGRRQGMSEEFLSLLKWLVIVIGCAFAYQPLGQFFSTETTVFSTFSCYLMAYMACAMIILALFGLLKRWLGGKLLGSDMFGRAEYYLGMGSGAVRFCCILLAGLAMLNARGYDVREVKAMQTFQKNEFGSEYFPTLQTVQAAVFDESLTGPWIRDNMGSLLIRRTVPERKEFKQKEFTLP